MNRSDVERFHCLGGSLFLEITHTQDGFMRQDFQLKDQLIRICTAHDP